MRAQIFTTCKPQGIAWEPRPVSNHVQRETIMQAEKTPQLLKTSILWDCAKYICQDEQNLYKTTQDNLLQSHAPPQPVVSSSKIERCWS